MLIGYARVSTADQDLAHQNDALVRAGVAERDIHTDTASGAFPRHVNGLPSRDPSRAPRTA
jgi:DNA invertase Pin-like site-specific DNA recombinase